MLKAMILAAGLGTRLKPFTDSHPKALYRFEGSTLLEHALKHLITAGIKDVIINVHHFADQIIEYLYLNNNFGFNVSISNEEGELLETGGGVKKAAWFFEGCDAAIVRNADIISDLNLSEMARFHLGTGALATLAVRDRATSRYFLFGESMQLCGWKNQKTGEHRVSKPLLTEIPLAFSGIQVLDPKIFGLIQETGKFSLTELYLRLAESQKIIGYPEEGTVWMDIGRGQ
jgi:NDP-sugar pyrophosphorylase family protein